MIDNKYTVTFKTSRAGDKYINDDGELEESDAGHMWYVLRKNDQEMYSFGFQPEKGVNILLIDKGEIKTTDEARYLEYLPPITIQINQQQYEILKKFGDNTNGAKALGFDPTYYNGLYHNCVQYVFRALYLIGYNPENDEWEKTPLAGARLPTRVSI